MDPDRRVVGGYSIDVAWIYRSPTEGSVALTVPADGSEVGLLNRELAAVCALVQAARPHLPDGCQLQFRRWGTARGLLEAHELRAG